MIDYKTLKAKVLYILSTEEDSRNSDIPLTIKLWQHYPPDTLITGKDGKQYINVRSLFDLPREDNIKRARAEVQNVERRYLPTDISIFIKRAHLSDEWKTALGYRSFWSDAD